MSGRQLELAIEWLEKARHDLFAVDKLAADKSSPPDIIAFHSQQAAEKALKGFLTAHGIKFPRTHDLAQLADLAIPVLPTLARLREQLGNMTQYGTEIRYPDSATHLSTEEIRKACECAWAVFATIEQHLHAGGAPLPSISSL